MSVEESQPLRPIRIILVEDNPGDVVMTEERLLTSKVRTGMDEDDHFQLRFRAVLSLRGAEEQQ